MSDDVRTELHAAYDARVARDRRSALAIGGIVAVTLVALGAGALFLSDTLRMHGGAQPALAERIRATTGTTVPAAPRGCRSGLTPESPLRLWIGGDSLAGSLGPSLGEQTAATGVVQPVYDSRVSSGLSSPEFFDWPNHAADEMARLNPEVVVFIVGANDWSTPRTTPTDASGQPAWRAEYAQGVEEMLDTLEGPATRAQPRPVYWVGAPTLQERRKDAGAREVNAIARAVVARHPSATYIDAYELFSSSTGAYTATLAGPKSKTVRVRTTDGVHFTPEGGDLLGVAVYGPLDARCRLDAQAVPGRPKPVIQTKGSTQVPGTHRDTADATTPTLASTLPPTVPPTTAATGATTTSTTASTTTTTPTTAPPPPPP
jgi:hypothetical protein